MTAILNVIFVLGLVAVAVGAGMIFLPAGVIVGGLLAATSSLLLVAGAQQQQVPPGPEAPRGDR